MGWYWSGGVLGLRVESIESVPSVEKLYSLTRGELVLDSLMRSLRREGSRDAVGSVK